MAAAKAPAARLLAAEGPAADRRAAAGRPARSAGAEQQDQPAGVEAEAESVPQRSSQPVSEAWRLQPQSHARLPSPPWCDAGAGLSQVWSAQPQ